MEAKNKTTKIVYTIIISIAISSIIYFSKQIAASEIVLIRSNDDAKLTIVSGKEESVLGIIPQNTLVKIRIPKGTHELLFHNDKQIIKKLINIEGEIKEPIYVHFEEIKTEKLRMLNESKF